MILLSATNINKYYATTPVLTNVSFHISQGDRIGIVGANGAGKTTLLNILTGELSFDDGDFFLPADATVGYLKQQDNFRPSNTVYQEMLAIFQPVIDMEHKLASLSEEISQRSSRNEDVEQLLHQYDDLSHAFQLSDGYSYKSEINGILNSMAFSEDFYDKQISLLSGGERTRLALAALLLKKPDLLLLDEPTNHLDIGTLKWLEQYLKAYSGTLVVISHDRYFLDQTVTRVFEVENHKLTCYDGNYTAYVEKKRLREEDAMRKYENQQKEIAKQEEMIRRFKQHGTEKLAKRAQSREKRLAHLDVLDRPDSKPGKMRIQFKERLQSGNDVLYGEALSKSFGSGDETRRLFQNVSFDIKKGSRVCLVGPNGIGKTSLLKIIMGELEPDTGYIKTGHNVIFGYYDQEQQRLTPTNTVLEELHSEYRLYTETELRSLLGRFLFRGEDVFKSVGALSGGEKARLALLKLMLSGANLLIMDEPTNHLDIASKEIFEDALLEFPGTLLLVSHDRYFLNKIPSSIYELSEDGAAAYVGGYDYYLEKKQQLPSGKNYLSGLSRQSSTDGTLRTQTDAKSLKELRAKERRQLKEKQAEERRRERRLQDYEEKIASLEQRIETIQAELCKEEIYTDFEKAARHDANLRESKDELERIYEEWLILQDGDNE